MSLHPGAWFALKILPCRGDASRQIDLVRACLDRRLRLVFDYLHDLTTQLNYLKPAIARRYFFLDSDDAFRDLAWLEGFADFRSLPERDGGHIERVTLGYTLKGSGERTLERALTGRGANGRGQRDRLARRGVRGRKRDPAAGDDVALYWSTEAGRVLALAKP